MIVKEGQEHHVCSMLENLHECEPDFFKYIFYECERRGILGMCGLSLHDERAGREGEPIAIS